MAKRPNFDEGTIGKNETLYRNNQPTAQNVAPPYRAGAPTMKPGATDGINKPIPATNNTRAPGQYGRS